MAGVSAGVVLGAWLAGYLAGSVPFGLLFARWAGAGDVRRIGSGNIGATNVLRTGRHGLALATLLADALKGALPVWVAQRGWGLDLAAQVGVAAVLGHCFPVWLRFRGGKGVATATGVLFALTPLLGLVALLVFVVVVAITRYVSAGSLAAAFATPLFALAWGREVEALAYAFVATVVIVRHRDNIRRLLTGTERELRLRPGGDPPEEAD